MCQAMINVVGGTIPLSVSANRLQHVCTPKSRPHSCTCTTDAGVISHGDQPFDSPENTDMFVRLCFLYTAQFFDNPLVMTLSMKNRFTVVGRKTVHIFRFNWCTCAATL